MRILNSWNDYNKNLKLKSISLQTIFFHQFFEGNSFHARNTSRNVLRHDLDPRTNPITYQLTLVDKFR